MMRQSLGTRFAILVVGGPGLAIINSMVALVAVWRIEHLLARVPARNIPSIRAAEELEIALLELRGTVSAFLISGGDTTWLDSMAESQHRFRNYYQAAWNHAHTQRELDLLQELSRVVQRYQDLRELTIQFYSAGLVDEASRILLEDVQREYQIAFDVCEEFLDANDAYVETTVRRAGIEARRLTGVVTALLVLTAACSGLLVWFFFAGIVVPLRGMVASVRTFQGEETPEAARPPGDELAAVGSYLESLMSDVSDTRSLLRDNQSRMWESAKLASVGKLAASVAHEIRNPLTAMKMWLFSIRRSVAQDAELSRKVDLVAEEMVRLEGIVQGFLEFSRPAALDPRPVRVDQVLDKTLELLRHALAAHGIQVQRETCLDVPALEMDPEQLKQVFLNLMANSVDAMPHGGQLHITCCVQQDGAGRDMIVVRIQDSGEGMPEDVKSKIFQPFFTTKQHGTGLGLPIAARIMALHGGRLVLEASHAEGTRFAVWLPLPQPASPLASIIPLKTTP